MTEGSKPFVSIVMPALNEEAYITAAIELILPRTDAFQYELLVVDGGSTDRTLSIVQGLSETNARIRIISNERRIQSAAVNIAAQVADPRSRYLVRADCHSKYPEGFVERCIASLNATKAASVVVSMRTCGRSCLQRAIAAAQNSRLGNGGSAHRLLGRSGFVDHGHHAAFDRDIYLELGGYDEEFSYNEDAEFDSRIIKSGRKIYLDGDLGIDYFPRSDFWSLARQYFNFGTGRANTLLKHRSPPKLRQLLPVGVLLACVPAAALSVFDIRLLAPAALYAASCTVWGLALAAMEKDRCLLASGPAAMVMHMSWALGFLRRLTRFGLVRISKARPISRPTTPALSRDEGHAPLADFYAQRGRATQSK